MEYTTNLNLKKPDVNEYYDIEKNNENMDLIDTAVGELNSQVGTETLTTTAQNCTGAINELNKKLSVCPQETFSNWESLLNSLNNGITIFRPSDLKTLSPISGTMDDWGTVTIIKAGHVHETSIIWHSVNVPNNYTREVYIGIFDGTQVSWDKLN